MILPLFVSCTVCRTACHAQMDRYVRVEQARESQPSIEDNEIRVMSSGKLHSYVAYATTLFTVR